MQIPVKLSNELVENAKHYGEIFSRSTPKQIEYWSKIGKIAEENPDLPFNFIKQLLIAQQEEAEPFSFDQ